MAKMYNIYYHGSKVNKRPLDYDMLKQIFEKKSIYKKQDFSQDLIEIPVKDIEIVKCIVI
jgi:hypothetical protein